MKKAKVLLILLMLIATADDTSALTQSTILSSMLVSTALIGATTTSAYIYNIKQLLSGLIMLRDEPEWKNSLFLRFSEDDRLCCRWAESRWPSAYDLMYARKHQKSDFCKAIDGGARGGFKAKYIGCQYYLLMFVQDLEEEIHFLDSLRGSLLFSKRFLPGIRSYAHTLLEKIDFYAQRAVALKYAIVTRETYQKQVEDRFRRENIDQAQEASLIIHTEY